MAGGPGVPQGTREAGGPGVPQGTRNVVMTAADVELFPSVAKSHHQRVVITKEYCNGRDRHGFNARHKMVAAKWTDFADMPGEHASDLLSS